MANLLDRNTLFYGDNLPILREYIPSESIDLIYLDPPFNSNRSYNVLFKNESGTSSEAQITAFDDTWNWCEATEELLASKQIDMPPPMALSSRPSKKTSPVHTRVSLIYSLF